MHKIIHQHLLLLHARLLAARNIPSFFKYKIWVYEYARILFDLFFHSGLEMYVRGFFVVDVFLFFCSLSFSHTHSSY